MLIWYLIETLAADGGTLKKGVIKERKSSLVQGS